MKLVFLFLFLFLFMPYIGLFTLTPGEENFVGQVDNYLIFAYSIHITIILFFIFSILLLLKNKDTDKIYISNEKILKKYKAIILILFIVIFINLFFFGGYKILIGEMGRGDFRTTLGFFGFIYNLTTLFLPAGLLALSASYYMSSIEPAKIKKQFYIIFFLSMLIGVFTGFKSTAVVIAFVGFAVLSSKLKIKYFILLGLFLLSFLLFSAYYFMEFTDILSALNYLFERSTSTAVAGTIAVWNLFPNGGEESSVSLLYMFGNKIASYILGIPENSVDFLKVNLSRYIAYRTYPNYEEALSGAFNLTVTNFGYAVYYFGKYYFFLYSIFIGIVLGSLIYIFRYKNKDITFHSTFTTYLFIAVLIGGGKISNIFAFTTLVYVLLLYLILKIISSKIVFKKKQPLKMIHILLESK